MSTTPIPTPSGNLTSTSRNCLQRAIKYLHRAQQPNGGWVGSWGICFTYAAQFALESLSLVGETYETSEYSRKGCEFLLKRQREDGGWGESWEVREFSSQLARNGSLTSGRSSLALLLSGLRRMMPKSFKLPGRLWVSCTPNTLTLSRSSGPSSSSCRGNYPCVLYDPRTTHVSSHSPGWFMGARSDRGDVQPDGCDLVSKLQVLVHNLDVGQG